MFLFYFELDTSSKNLNMYINVNKLKRNRLQYCSIKLFSFRISPLQIYIIYTNAIQKAKHIKLTSRKTLKLVYNVTLVNLL